MKLEDTVREIIKKNPKIKQAIKEKPELKYKLSEIVDDYYAKNKYLIKWAQFNDKVGRLLGPAEAGIRHFSDLFTPGMIVYSAAKLLHYGILKLPYTIYYAAKTKDVKGTMTLTLAEIAKYVIPYGGIGDIYPLYQKTLDKYIVKNSARSLEDYLSSEKQGVKGKETVQGDVKVPKRLVRDYPIRIANDKIYADMPSPAYDLRFSPAANDSHFVYLVKKKGLFPNIYTTLTKKIPSGVNALTLHKKGLIKKAA
ncbi:hypothetical protein ACFLZX_02840 [Nanoarchaeota archaeon]